MGTEDLTVATPPGTGRRRRTFTEAFKAEAIECCLQLGVSIAAVARAYDLHPNLLRRWVVAHREGQKHSDDAVDVVGAETPFPMETVMPLVESPTTFVSVRRMEGSGSCSDAAR